MLLEKNTRAVAAPEPLPAGQPIAVRGPGSEGFAKCGHILIIADDLTGACDSAVCFVASGRKVRVILDAGEPDGRTSVSDSGVLAISTESRSLGAEAAAATVAGCITRHSRRAPGDLFFKKIDSAARGPIAAEIDAALRASGAPVALVTPALPAERRTVSGGVLSVRDWTGQDISVDLRKLFAGTTGVSILPAWSEERLFRSMEQAIEAGTRILLCDAAHQADLDRLATAGVRLTQPILWAGSAGLARALARHLPVPQQPAVKATRRFGRALLFTGTPHPVTALQVEHLEHASGGVRGRAIHRLPESGASCEQVVSAFRAGKPAALILTGGDTASFVLRALDAKGISLAGEVAPGMPWGTIERGFADGCTVVTKSGGFGERDALVRAFEFCESDCEAKSAP